MDKHVKISHSSPHHHETRFYWLDWARFLAAFWVLVVHVRGFNWVAYGDLQAGSQDFMVATFFAITRVGYEAVILFFVLSGFLVGGKLIERSLTNSFDLRSYTIDRVSRIYVPLIPIIIFSVLLAFLGNQHEKPAAIAGNLLGLQGVFFDPLIGNGPLWSLAYELWFYVMAGAAAVLIAGKRSRVIAFLTLLISLLVFLKLDPALLMVWWLAAFGYFLKGTRRLLAPGIAMSILGGVCLQLASNSTSVSVDFQFLNHFPNSVFVLLFGTGLTLAISAISDWPPNRQLTSHLERLGTKLAAFSYTLYLVHYPILVLWSRLDPAKHSVMDVSSFWGFFSRIMLCIIVCLIFFALFESRTALVRRWLKARPGFTLAPSRP